MPKTTGFVGVMHSGVLNCEFEDFRGVKRRRKATDMGLNTYSEAILSTLDCIKQCLRDTNFGSYLATLPSPRDGSSDNVFVHHFFESGTSSRARVVPSVTNHDELSSLLTCCWLTLQDAVSSSFLDVSIPSLSWAAIARSTRALLTLFRSSLSGKLVANSRLSRFFARSGAMLGGLVSSSNRSSGVLN